MRRQLIAGALALALTASGAPAAAQTTPAPVVLERGHTDVLYVGYTDGRLVLDVLYVSGRDSVTSPPAGVVLTVPDAAKLTVPDGPMWSFLGPAGNAAWVLPQRGHPGLLAAGWDTSEVPFDVLDKDATTFHLTAVDGPGRFSVYTTSSFGAPGVIFDSGDGLPDTRVVPVFNHTHANWAFSAPGTYRITFEVTAKLAATGADLSTGPHTYTFVVG